MNSDEISMNGNHRRQIILSKVVGLLGVFGLIVSAFLLDNYLVLGSQNDYLTVQEVMENRYSLNGKNVTIRGNINILYIMQTLLLCIPDTCHCNDTYVEYSFDGIEIDELSCSGDQCAIQCSPFNPQTGDVYIFVGTLLVRGERIILRDIDFEASRQLIEGRWVPIPTGAFNVRINR